MFPCRPYFGIHIDGSPEYREKIKMKTTCLTLTADFLISNYHTLSQKIVVELLTFQKIVKPNDIPKR